MQLINEDELTRTCKHLAALWAAYNAEWEDYQLARKETQAAYTRWREAARIAYQILRAAREQLPDPGPEQFDANE